MNLVTGVIQQYTFRRSVCSMIGWHVYRPILHQLASTTLGIPLLPPPPTTPLPTISSSPPSPTTSNNQVNERMPMFVILLHRIMLVVDNITEIPVLVDNIVGNDDESWLVLAMEDGRSNNQSLTTHPTMNKISSSNPNSGIIGCCCCC